MNGAQETQCAMWNLHIQSLPTWPEILVNAKPEDSIPPPRKCPHLDDVRGGMVYMCGLHHATMCQSCFNCHQFSCQQRINKEMEGKVFAFPGRSY